VPFPKTDFNLLARLNQSFFGLFYFRCRCRTIRLDSHPVPAPVAKCLGLGEPVGSSIFWQRGAVIRWPLAGEMDFRRNLRRMRTPARARQLWNPYYSESISKSTVKGPQHTEYTYSHIPIPMLRT